MRERDQAREKARERAKNSKRESERDQEGGGQGQDACAPGSGVEERDVREGYGRRLGDDAPRLAPLRRQMLLHLQSRVTLVRRAGGPPCHSVRDQACLRPELDPVVEETQHINLRTASQPD